MLQACIDDSGHFQQGKTCLLAGCVAPVEEWLVFSDRWDAALKEAPALPYFKMSDAFALRKTFNGWTAEERDVKVDKFVDVLLDTKIVYSVAVAMKNADYLTAGPHALGHKVGEPFYFLFTTVMEACLVYQKNNGIHEKVDFIFDESNKPEAEIRQIFEQTMFTAPQSIKALGLVDNLPMFRNDRTFLPLQAADLIAGQIRGFQEHHNETSAMKKLSDNGFRVDYNLFDARRFKVITEGATQVRNYTQFGGPAGLELERFNSVKTFIEELWGV